MLSAGRIIKAVLEDKYLHLFPLAGFLPQAIVTVRDVALSALSQPHHVLTTATILTATLNQKAITNKKDHCAYYACVKSTAPLIK